MMKNIVQQYFLKFYRFLMIICTQTILQASILLHFFTLNVWNDLLSSYQGIRRLTWRGIIWNKPKRLHWFNGNLSKSCAWIIHKHQHRCYGCSTVMRFRQLTVLPKYFGGFFDKSDSRQLLPSTEHFGNL